jgi:hypothetical protein
MLPYEMLVRVADLLDHGYTPRVAVLGLTWRNLVRDTQLRWEVRDALRDHAFAATLPGELGAVGAAPAILDALAADRRLVAEDEARDRSYADRGDELLFHTIAPRVFLVGMASYLRADVQRALAEWLADHLATARSTGFDYDIAPSDLAFNLACLRALVALLHARGVTVLAYLAPERSDVSPLVDPRDEESTIRALATETGIELADARHVVPDELWGWERDSPDRSHFTEPGHSRLARFLADEGAARHIWDVLDR